MQASGVAGLVSGISYFLIKLLKEGFVDFTSTSLGLDGFYITSQMVRPFPDCDLSTL